MHHELSADRRAVPGRRSGRARKKAADWLMDTLRSKRSNYIYDTAIFAKPNTFIGSQYMATICGSPPKPPNAKLQLAQAGMVGTKGSGAASSTSRSPTQNQLGLRYRLQCRAAPRAARGAPLLGLQHVSMPAPQPGRGGGDEKYNFRNKFAGVPGRIPPRILSRTTKAGCSLPGPHSSRDQNRRSCMPTSSGIELAPRPAVAFEGLIKSTAAESCGRRGARTMAAGGRRGHFAGQ